MKLNRQKRIGEVVVVTEGSRPEFDLIKGIFHDFLGYSVASKRRGDETVTELNGYDKYSRVILLNSPSSNINCLEDAEAFYDFLYREIALKYNVDLFNDPTYIVFDRDRVNNRFGVVKRLMCALDKSQTDTDEQNGLLLLNYPSVEAFQVSLFEENSFDRTFALGKDAKAYVEANGYVSPMYDEKTVLHATCEFLKYLKREKIIDFGDDLLTKTDMIGPRILERQTAKYARDNTFACVSQLVEMLIDLGIVEI